MTTSAATQYETEGVGSLEDSTAQKPVPPLSEKTLALAGELEARRHAEVMTQAVAMAVGATLVKLDSAKRITLTQDDFRRFTENYDVVMEPLKDGDVTSIRLVGKVRGVK